MQGDFWGQDLAGWTVTRVWTCMRVCFLCLCACACLPVSAALTVYFLMCICISCCVKCPFIFSPQYISSTLSRPTYLCTCLMFFVSLFLFSRPVAVLSALMTASWCNDVSIIWLNLASLLDCGYFLRLCHNWHDGTMHRCAASLHHFHSCLIFSLHSCTVEFPLI